MYIDSTNSTNTLLKELIAKGGWQEGERFIRAGYQTAGRGQTGNVWESESGKNLLCSILLPPCREPFYLNVAVSVAVCRLVKRVLERSGLGAMSEAVTVKWPNDIYYGDRKLAGILIEGAILGGEMRYAVAGIGLNVNQTEWHSDAPNPVSMKQMTGCEYYLDELMAQLMQETDRALAEDVWDYYKAHLYRREGYWPFVEREVSTAPTMNADSRQPIADIFTARILDVLPTGEIMLEDSQARQRTYHFKQVRYVI